MLQPPDVALAHYSDRQSLVTAGAEVAGQMWAEVNPDRIVESWTAQVPELTAVLSGAQLGAARQADPYLDEVAAWQELDPATASPIDPRAFAGAASDGRGLMSLLMSPAFSALQVIASGLGSMQGLSLGRQHLDTIARTQVADAGRLADGVALAARGGLDGYMRVVVGKTCSRCLLLAGKKYHWNAGFRRHNRCDCVHLPCKLAEHLQVIQDPGAIYRSMTAKERQRAGWSLADQQAIADGADLAQITNAHRGVYTAGGRKFTTEGTTKRGFARSRLGKRARMTPEQIYAEAIDRDEALRLLYDHGYLVNEPAIVRRAEGARAIARPGVGPTPAELAADPALKMTVAELKAIAKDNGVPLYGATKKNDIISTIRQWENDKLKSGGKVLLPDGPIGKPISFKPEPIEAPPLGVPSASQKVLSGSSLNDWADYFVYDRQYARHEFVDAAGNTAAEGVRVQDLRAVLGSTAEGIGDYVVRTGTAWRFDGVAYLIEHGPDDFGAPWVSRALHELRAAHEAIPAAARANQSYAVLSGRNPGDMYWARRFNNPGHTAAASASHGHIDIWRFQSTTSRIDVDVLRHETGHNLDDLVSRHAHGSESPAWASAADADAASAARIKDLKSDPYVDVKAEVDPARDFARGVTDYGKSSAAEDYAESVMLYQRGEIAFGQPAGEAAARRLYFRDVYPERAKILDAQFPEIAKEQQQAIAELKTKATAPAVAPVADVSKLNVTQLRALAKERGIKVPSKALKADIVKLLQGGTAPAAPLAGAAKRAAARVRQAEIDRRGAAGDLLANMDELIAKKADRAVFVERLDYAATTGVDAATVAALRLVIDDKTKLRAAMTRIGTKNGLKPVGRAGTKVKFDETLHDALGAPPAPGAQVLVVRRGTTLTLDGETIPLDRAKVTTAVAPAKKVTPAKPTQAVPEYHPPAGVDKSDVSRMRQLIARDHVGGNTVLHDPAFAADEVVGLSRKLSDVDKAWLQDMARQQPGLYARLTQELNIKERFAETAKRLGERDLREFKVRFAAQLRELVAGKPIGVRIGDEAALRSLLTDGRFKTSFDEGVARASGMHSATEVRAMAEQAIWGYPIDMSPALRPIYGYVMPEGVLPAGEKSADLLSYYGQIQIVLKPEIQARATVSFADSLDAFDGVRPSPIDKPTWDSSMPFRDKSELTSAQFRQGGYIEAQLHGGVTTGDIAEVIFPSVPDAATQSALRGAGIPWRMLAPR